MLLKKIVRSFFAAPSKPLAVFLGILLFFSGGYLFFETFFPHFTEKSLYPFFAFSWKGLKDQKWWQIFTFFFIDSPLSGLSFSFFFGFFIKFYTLRLLALSTSQIKGFFSFISLYVFSALTGLIFTLPLLILKMPFFLFSNFAGPIYGSALAWIMLHPNTRLFLFFRIPFKASSLFNWFFFSSVIFDIFEENYLEALFYLGCAFFGYFYALFGWGCLGPYPVLHKWEKKAIELTFFLRRKKKKCQIYDFRSYKKES